MTAKSQREHDLAILAAGDITGWWTPAEARAVLGRRGQAP